MEGIPEKRGKKKEKKTAAIEGVPEKVRSHVGALKKGLVAADPSAKSLTLALKPFDLPKS